MGNNNSNVSNFDQSAFGRRGRIAPLSLCAAREYAPMARHRTLSDQILAVMHHSPDCRLDELAMTCQDYPWQAVFIEVNRLSLEGQLRLTIARTGVCTVQLISRALPVQSREGLIVTREKTMKKNKEKSQQGRRDQKSNLLRKWGSLRVPQPTSVRLTCSEAELEVLMSEGESA